MFLNVFKFIVGSMGTTQFLIENELRKKQALKLCTVRLMPTVEAMESLWDMNTCISRGIKEKYAKKESLER